MSYNPMCDVCGEETWSPKEGVKEEDGTQVCLFCLAESDASFSNDFGIAREYPPVQYTERTCHCEDWPCCGH